MDEVVAIAREQLITRRRFSCRFRCKNIRLPQVVEQRRQRRERRHPPLARRASMIQEPLGNFPRELFDAEPRGRKPAIQLAHQHQVALH